MPNQSFKKGELPKLINEEIRRRRQLGEAERCTASARQIAYHTENANGGNWHLSSLFRSSRPSGDVFDAIVKAATKRLQKLHNPRSEAA